MYIHGAVLHIRDDMHAYFSGCTTILISTSRQLLLRNRHGALYIPHAPSTRRLIPRGQRTKPYSLCSLSPKECPAFVPKCGGKEVDGAAEGK